jgi:hypothetical protein
VPGAEVGKNFAEQKEDIRSDDRTFGPCQSRWPVSNLSSVEQHIVAHSRTDSANQTREQLPLLQGGRGGPTTSCLACSRPTRAWYVLTWLLARVRRQPDGVSDRPIGPRRAALPVSVALEAPVALWT